jgi:Domain of unknown function (DUF4385)/SnoaL-like polyketide cyclase
MGNLRHEQCPDPDLRVDIEDMVLGGDRVAARAMHRGTHRGNFLGITPTGRSVAYEGTVIFRIADGRIAERWGTVDLFAILWQLGSLHAFSTGVGLSTPTTQAGTPSSGHVDQPARSIGRNRCTQYRDAGDFVGMDMARKFLQMGWTRARRYANHRTGRKWSDGRTAELLDQVDETKAECAQIFYARYLEARENPVYVAARTAHRAARKAASTPRTERF